MKYFLSGMLALILFTSSTLADDIVVTDAWARPTANAKSPGGAFLTITNHTDNTVIVTHISSDIANMAHIHNTVKVEGMMSMEMLDELEIKAGESATFKPGGMHIMLMGLSQKLTKGDHFTLTISFDKAGDIVVPVEVTGMMGPR